MTALLPELNGAEEVEALIACARAMAGSENTQQMFEWAERAIALARTEAPELEARGLAVLGEVGTATAQFVADTLCGGTAAICCTRTQETR